MSVKQLQISDVEKKVARRPTFVKYEHNFAVVLAPVLIIQKGAYRCLREAHWSFGTVPSAIRSQKHT